MAQLNVKERKLTEKTYEGGRASGFSPEQELKRAVSCCLLWERSFYEDGISIVDRIKALVPLVKPEIVRDMAINARMGMKLRHVPLLLCRELARGGNLYANTLDDVIQRPDELAEFLAIYWEDGKCPLSAQVKKGLAKAFTKFDEYQLGKYNRDRDIKLRDVLFMCHAKPKDKDQEEVWNKLVDGTLSSPDTWEVALSGGEDKKTVWERLIGEERLGGMALIRNLRNMMGVGVPDNIIRQALNNMKASRILPFRFIAAAKYAPRFEPELEGAMFRCLKDDPKLLGETTILVDRSYSMVGTPISKKSEIDRLQAAMALSILAREVCEHCRVFSFSNDVVEHPPRRGFALRDVIDKEIKRGTYLGKAIKEANKTNPDRIIVITDEQSHDAAGGPNGKGYMINVAGYKNGISHDGPWEKINGWSESIIKYIQEIESMRYE